MAIINTGTATLMNNSKTVVFSGADYFTKGEGKAGTVIKFGNEPTMHMIGVNASDNITITLQEEYLGVTQSGVSFEMYVDTLANGIVKKYPTMTNAAYVDNYNNQLLLNLINGTNNKTIITSRFWNGEPVQDVEFGHLKVKDPREIEQIIAYSQAPIVGGLVIDYAIDGTWQNLNLTFDSGGTKKSSASDLSVLLSVGEELKFRCPTVSAPAGNNITVDVHWKNIGVMIMYYDWVRGWFGDLVVGGRLGEGLTFPTTRKVFGISYTLRAPAIGQDIILELELDGVATGATATISAGSTSGYLVLSATDFTSSEACSIKINQVGTVPGNDLFITVHSYEID
ncbi:MAG: hypothetical protein E3K37_01245 [Candidatus Kuenenia sp.]|nr:hypothetical protein [Candidatus Kuenenia hertensis]